VRVLALWGVLTGERADEADRETSGAELLRLDAPERRGELVRPHWLQATTDDAARRGDRFRVA
jgi:hypothetical protein